MAFGVLVLGPPATAAFAPLAHAQGTDSHDTAFKSGLDEYGRGNYVGAITTWESLLATIGEERGYKVLYNLGLAYQQIGDVTHAIERFRSFAKQVEARAAADPDLTARGDDARKRASDLEASHGAVFVKAPERGNAVLTRVGTAEPRTAGYVVWLAPGTHTIELFVGTARAKSVRVDVVAGKQVDVDTTPDAEPAPVATPPPPLAPPPASGWTPRSTWLVVGAGLTVVSVALPLGLLSAANGKKDDAEALGRGHTGYADARSAYDSSRTAYMVSWALPVALGLTTAGFWIFGRDDDGHRASAKVNVTPSGAMVSGSF